MAAEAVESALGTDQIGTVSVAVIVGLLVIGVLLALVMNKLIGRVILAVIIIGLGVFVWTQRTTLEDRAKKCETNVSYFGFHINLSSSAQQRCASISR